MVESALVVPCTLNSGYVWLRSPNANNGNNFVNGTSGGGPNNNNASNGMGVPVGFAL